MYKKLVYSFGLLLTLIMGISCIKYEKQGGKIATKSVAANSVDLNLDCSSAYLIEQKTGKVLYAQNECEKLKPASMTKMMGLLLVCEKIYNNTIKLDDIVAVSDQAARMGGSQVFLEPNEKISVHDLLKSVCISSANDSMYALGEYIATTNDNFINMMNKKANDINLENTHFVNVTGFDDDNHYTCAKDMATIAQNLLKYESIILPYTSMYEGYIRENTDNPFWLVNTNKLVRFYEGLDGLKTGYTSGSGFCLTATAKRNDVRLISVIMNASSSAKRNEMTKSLLDYGFNKIKSKKMYSANEKIGTLKVLNSKQNKVDLYTTSDIVVMLDNEIENPKIKQIIKTNKDIKAPLKKGDIVGKLIVEVENDIYEFDLMICEDIKEYNYINRFFDTLKSILA